MKIKLLVAAAATVVASGAMAQSAFDGFYGQIATGYENNTVASSQLVVNPYGGDPTSGGKSSGSNNVSSGTAPLIVGLGYTYSVAPKFSVGLGADYSTLSSTTGTANYSFGQYGTANVQYKISNRYNIYLTPGYAIDKDKLAYVKVGYSNETIQGQPQSAGVTMNSSTLSGYVVGLGYKQMISNGFYGFGEVNYYGYNSANINGTTVHTGGAVGGISVNPTVSAYNALVGVGYKF